MKQEYDFSNGKRGKFYRKSANLRVPNALREIHRIQEKIYEERKNMSTKEELVVIRRSAEEAKKRLGLKLRKLEHSKT